MLRISHPVGYGANRAISAIRGVLTNEEMTQFQSHEEEAAIDIGSSVQSDLDFPVFS